MDYEHLTEEQQTALSLAQDFVQYCRKHNFPKDTILAGVALYGDYVKVTAYEHGVADEKSRMRKLLGLGDIL
jgi:hypothetical protein